MKKTITILWIVLSGTLWCSAQTTDTTIVDPWPSCQAYFTSAYNDSVMLFKEGYMFNFTDLSNGNILHWNWNFGDSITSDEQNPHHCYNNRGIYNVCLEVSGDQCKSTYCSTVYAGLQPPCNVTGIVKDYTGLDGCGLLIGLDDGELLEPAEIVPDYKLQAGQHIRLSYIELTNRESICMAGKIVRVTCIEEIQRDSCSAAFTHYALPWVSSMPPLYQFECLSSPNASQFTWDFGDGTTSSEASPTHRYAFSGYYTVCLTVSSDNGCSDTRCETCYFEGNMPQTGLCDNFIRLTTDITLDGHTCNGTATAGLVNSAGDRVYASIYLWSNGETGATVTGLCPGMVYTVIATDSSGCAVSGSFSFDGTYSYPDSLFGYLNYRQNDMDFVFNLPVYSDSVYCTWEFGDGSTADGSTVNHTYESDSSQTVLLKVFDLVGNLLYDQKILITPGLTTGTRDPIAAVPVVYPVPAVSFLNIRMPEADNTPDEIEVISSSGQMLMKTRTFDLSNRTVHIEVNALPAGFYLGRLRMHDGSVQTFRFLK
jgi:PKD repeat protein